MDSELNQDILNCKNVSVVLRKRESSNVYIEGYRLNNIVYQNGRFWGKFANAHCPHGHKGVGPWELLSYAYNNYSPVVCILSVSQRMERYSSANAYSDISFVASGNYRKIWSIDEGNSNGELQKSIVFGRKLKAKIESTDGFIYVVPVHTIVMFEETGSFEIETEFDAIPNKIRNFDSMEDIASQFSSFLEKNPSVPYVSTDSKFNRDFFLTYFAITNTSIYQRLIDGNGDIKNDKFKFNKVEIWAENS